MSLRRHGYSVNDPEWSSEHAEESKKENPKKGQILARVAKGLLQPLTKRNSHPLFDNRTPSGSRRRRSYKEPHLFVRSYKNTPTGNLQEFAISGYILPDFLNSLQESNLDHLTKVDLDNNFLYRYPTTFRRLLAILPVDSLESLTLRWNGIDVNAARKLAQKLPMYRKLHSINLAENELGPKGLSYLMEVGHLYWVSNVVELSDCGLGDCGASVLGNYLKRSDICWMINSLCVADNEITDKGAKLLAKGLSRNSSGRLQSLDLSKNCIEDDGVKAIADAAAQSSLRELYLHNNRFDAKGVYCLASQLKSGKLGSLRKLDLSSNAIGDTGAWLIAEALESPLCTLKELFLSNTQISNRGVGILATALEGNKQLKRLALHGNHEKVNRQGARYFVRCLSLFNTTLVALTLLDRTYDNHLLNDRLDDYLELNRCGWHHVGNLQIPLAAWSRVWAKSTNNADLLYRILRTRPDLLLVR